MKLLTLLVISIAIISSYAFPESDLLRRNLTVNYTETETESDKLKVSEDCLMEIVISPYSKCLPTIKLDNYETVCNDIYRTDSCQQFYKNPLDYYEYCDIMPRILFTSIITTNLICEMDEDNKLCPLPKSIVTGTATIANQKDIENILKETCKSPRCTDQLLFYNKMSLTGLKEFLSSEEIASLESDNEYLESNKCQVKSVLPDMLTSHSNKIYTKMTYSLIISLIFLLFLL